MVSIESPGREVLLVHHMYVCTSCPVVKLCIPFRCLLLTEVVFVSGTKLQVVTGYGSHSKVKAAKIKPAVLNFFKNNGLK